MLIEEARWLAGRLAAMSPAELSPLLDVGSSTLSFRTRDQPWVEGLVFRPLVERGVRVVHMDAKAEPGVDIVADLSDGASVERLKEVGFRALLCSNLLEHVTDPRAIGRTLVGLLPAGGHLFVSGPFEYPYHPDPIDTMFRPSPDQLAGLFPNTSLVVGEIVDGGRYLDQIVGRPQRFLLLLLRVLLPFYKPAVWRASFLQLRQRIPWMFRHFRATCLVLRKD
jgi:hypothetical protein